MTQDGGTPPDEARALDALWDAINHAGQPALIERRIAEYRRAALGRSVPQPDVQELRDEIIRKAAGYRVSDVPMDWDWDDALAADLDKLIAALAGRSVPQEETMSEPIQVGGGYSTCPRCGEEYHNSIAHECRVSDREASDEIARLRRQLQGQIDDKHRILREYAALGAPPQGEPPPAEYDSAPSLGKITSMDEFLHGSDSGEPPTP